MREILVISSLTTATSFYQSCHLFYHLMPSVLPAIARTFTIIYKYPITTLNDCSYGIYLNQSDGLLID